MRVVGIEQLTDFMRKHPHARSSVQAWLAEAREAEWGDPSNVRDRFASVSFIGEHYVFNVGGNKYRLNTRINFDTQIVLILRIGTHDQYDTWSFD